MRRRTRKKVLGVVLVFLFLFVAIAAYVYENPNAISNVTKQFESSLKGGSSASTPINTQQSPYSVSMLYSAYTSNAAQADGIYSGNTAYISGLVVNVEQNNGQYQSCMFIPGLTLGSYVFGCSSLTNPAAGGDTVVWNWQSQTVASKVPTDSSFIATCAIGGLDSNGNLELNDCAVIS